MVFFITRLQGQLFMQEVIGIVLLTIFTITIQSH